MKFKLIAAAAVLAVSGAANATIAAGNVADPDFFFNIWDENTSYTVDLGAQGLTMSAFVSGLAASGDYSFTSALASDANFVSFISGVTDLSTLQWNLVSAEGVGQRSIYQTYTEGTLPETAQTASNGRSMVLSISNFTGSVNSAMEAGSDSVYVDSNSVAAWAGNFGCNNSFATQEFSNCGTTVNSTEASALSLVLENYNGSGTARGTFTPVVDGANTVKVYLDSSYNLHVAAVAAVPEPETYAMLLAGLGLMGAAARRRNKKA